MIFQKMNFPNVIFELVGSYLFHSECIYYRTILPLLFVKEIDKNFVVHDAIDNELIFIIKWFCNNKYIDFTEIVKISIKLDKLDVLKYLEKEIKYDNEMINTAVRYDSIICYRYLKNKEVFYLDENFIFRFDSYQILEECIHMIIVGEREHFEIISKYDSSNCLYVLIKHNKISERDIENFADIVMSMDSINCFKILYTYKREFIPKGNLKIKCFSYIFEEKKEYHTSDIEIYLFLKNKGYNQKFNIDLLYDLYNRNETISDEDIIIIFKDIINIKEAYHIIISNIHLFSLLYKIHPPNFNLYLMVLNHPYTLRHMKKMEIPGYEEALKKLKYDKHKLKILLNI